MKLWEYLRLTLAAVILATLIEPGFAAGTHNNSWLAVAAGVGCWLVVYLAGRRQ